MLIQTGDFGRVLTGTGLGLSHGIRHMNGGHGTESGSLVVVRMVVIGHRFHNAVAESPDSEQIGPDMGMIGPEHLPLGFPIRHLF